MNFLDILTGRAAQTYTGARYYRTIPTAVYPSEADSESSASYELFEYEYVDLTQRRYTKVFGNVITSEAAQTGIMTKSNIDFEPNAYVALKDGFLYQIMEVGEDVRNVSKEAARYLLTPVGVEKILRLNRVVDAWGIAGGR